MRHYEQGGGVVPLEWKAGEPDHHGGSYLLEVWTLTFSVMQVGEVLVQANIVAATWNNAVGAWCGTWPSGMATDTPIPNGANQRIRRHARLLNTSTTVTLTLGDW